jgi:hypothetical protein
MSSNNQLIIIKKKGKYQVHENSCVDNDFKANKDTLLKEFNIIEWALKFCNQYMKENLVEYGIYAHPSCWGKSRNKEVRNR